MNIDTLVESIGLSSEELKPYLIDEISEFLESTEKDHQHEEFHDVVFALKTLAYAHTGSHIDTDINFCINKLEKRLSEYGTISKKDPLFERDAISKVPIGVVHIAPGNFKQPWTSFDPVKSGTETEMVLLTDNEFSEKGNWTNHVIINFDSVDQLEYKFLTSTWDQNQKNTILCRIPDFLFKKSKEKGELLKNRGELRLQILAALKYLNIKSDAIFHLHSWEAGLFLSKDGVDDIWGDKKVLFSPYLTIGPLKEFMNSFDSKLETTLSMEEIETADKFESDLINNSDLTIVESDNNKTFYKRKYPNKNISVFSYSCGEKYVVEPDKNIKKTFALISGGRPVAEKGFSELLDEVPLVIKALNEKDVEFKLRILCKEYGRKEGDLKKSHYIKHLEDKIQKLNISNVVSIEDKVSIDELEKIISESDGLVVPSLYDPYCLMPHNSINANKISFVSKYAGVSENISSKEYLFDSQIKGSLKDSILFYLDNKSEFILENNNTPYTNIYIK